MGQDPNTPSTTLLPRSQRSALRQPISLDSFALLLKDIRQIVYMGQGIPVYPTTPNISSGLNIAQPVSGAAVSPGGSVVAVLLADGTWDIYTITDVLPPKMFPVTDRNSFPPGVSTIYDNTAGPHAATLRFSYTVPSGRGAIVEGIWMSIITSVVATTPASPFIIIYPIAIGTFPSGISQGTFGYLDLDASQNTAGSGAAYAWHVDGPLRAGWTLIGYSADASTGGTRNYVFGCNIAEFDA